jgi:hypothetical protein
LEEEMKSHRLTIIVLATALPALLAGNIVAAPLGTAISYSGRLQQSGNPANGSYDLKFALFDAPTNGTQFSLTLTNPAVTISNGLFSALLDFGAGAFNGDARWLEIGVRTNGATSFVTLDPRQRITAIPYALYAMTPLVTGSNGIVTGNSLVLEGGGKTWQLTVNSNGDLTISDGAILDFVSAFGIHLWKSMTVDGHADILGALKAGAMNVLGVSTFDGDINAKGNITAGGTITATNFVGRFTGDGSGLTNLPSVSAIPRMLVFTNDGTFVVPEGVTRVMVEVWGGGGGGGSGGFDGYDDMFGKGGGGGGYGRQVCDVTPGTNYPVTVGLGGGSDADGGTSSFGSLIQATGGQAGCAYSEPCDSQGLWPEGRVAGGTSSAVVNKDGQPTGDLWGSYTDGGATGFGGRGGWWRQVGIHTYEYSASVGPGGGGGAGLGPTPGNGKPGARGRVIVYY